MQQLVNKPVLVKGKKLLTSAQIALNTIKSSPVVGAKIAVASGNAGSNTVESHCLQNVILPTANIDIRYNELQSIIDKLTKENGILLATIGLLTSQKTDKPISVPTQNKPVVIPTVVIPTVVHDKAYCDESMRSRFTAVCKRVELDRITDNKNAYGTGKPYPSIQAFFLAQKVKQGKQNVSLMQVATLESLEQAYKISK